MLRHTWELAQEPRVFGTTCYIRDVRPSINSNTIPLRSNKLIHHLMLPPMILIFPSIFVKVSIRYVGKVKENGEVFCSNISKAAFKFQLGAGDVIEGWNVGIDGMRVGGKSRLTVPPILGYGSEGAAGIVPPNSWLVFEFELVKVR
ncbi:peptidyl-prolyl cis-trans isomerase FKBP53-like isoform X2 [Carica papaya]|uniref:peptidyl-prolyl cis-trans isomerase FKBP53-like isoform X2 n=1 Tax=Carica papaya TaxID=3649 RepID=UPI000B8CCFB7|nr:peptidyl-prolyl cis-trans isomerase FKBP53-like isoform X2 [Carica papaya]